MSQYAPEGNSVGVAISQPRVELKPLLTSILPMSRDYMSQYAPEGNSVGVAISQPRVELKPLLTSILPMTRDYTSWYAPRGNSVGVAMSSPGLRCAAPLPWVSSPTLLATLQELRLAEGVTINLPKWRLYFPYKIRIMSLSTHSSSNNRRRRMSKTHHLAHPPSA